MFYFVRITLKFSKFSISFLPVGEHSPCLNPSSDSAFRGNSPDSPSSPCKNRHFRRNNRFYLQPPKLITIMTIQTNDTQPLNKQHLTNEILIIDIDSHFDKSRETIVLGRYSPKSHRYQMMMTTMNFQILKDNSLEPHRYLAMFTSPDDSKVEIWALCNWRIR